jgi:signal transduction histidine kinase
VPAVAALACFAAVVVLAPAAGAHTPAPIALVGLGWLTALVAATVVLLTRRGARTRPQAAVPRPPVIPSPRAEDLARRGLPAAIRAVAEHEGRAGGFAVDVVVRDEAVGVHDELLLALARELLQNVAQHAGARRVRLDVRLEMDAVVLRCTDDGRGFRTPPRGAAPHDGHLGLAACTGRVEAVGGVMEVRSAPGRGTVVRAALPPNALLRSPRSFNRVP